MIFNKKSHLVGLDIGTSLIKVAEMKTSGKIPVLQKFGFTPIRPGLIEDGQIIEMDELSQVIRTLFKTHNIKSKNIAISTGGSSVVVKTISMPSAASSSEAALLESIRFEAEQYIPYDIDDMNVDFQVLGDNDGNADQMNVLLVAVKKDIVASYIELTDQAGLNAQVIDVDSFALQNIYEAASKGRNDGMTMLIDVGAHKTSLNIVKDNNSIMMRDSSSGLGQIWEEISSEANCNIDDAVKIFLGGGNESISAETLDEMSQNFGKMWSTEIQNIVKTFHSKSNYGKIDNVLVTGGGSLVSGFINSLSEGLVIPVSIFNPFEGVIVNPKKFTESFINQSAPFASIALGLALRKVNDK
ncbi:MAG: type IV pilus assembly protein PilM [Desulfamplus sp.]|nr:type IV pilus assembly protein PilM [Desulfamplus sp.]MBF0413604.1 type IV pilus assembly protein PilM [Desulfamplus sp.]